MRIRHDSLSDIKKKVLNKNHLASARSKSIILSAKQVIEQWRSSLVAESPFDGAASQCHHLTGSHHPSSLVGTHLVSQRPSAATIPKCMCTGTYLFIVVARSFLCRRGFATSTAIHDSTPMTNMLEMNDALLRLLGCDLLVTRVLLISFCIDVCRCDEK